MVLLCTLMVSGTVFVDQHRNDDHRPFDHQLPEVGDPHQGHTVIEGGDNQRPHQRTGDGADPADEAGAAKNDRGDGVQLVADPEVTVGAVQPGGRL